MRVVSWARVYEQMVGALRLWYQVANSTPTLRVKGQVRTRVSPLRIVSIIETKISKKLEVQ